MADNEYRRLGCRHCGLSFEPTQPSALYCSKRCKVSGWRQANPDRVAQYRANERKVSPYFAGYCAHCGAAFGSKRKRMHCSSKCENAAHYQRYKVSTAPATRKCASCCKIFAAQPHKTRPTEFCSAPCRQSSKRAQKDRRNAKLRGATVETVNPLRVFERDGWRCQLCGVKTPKAKRGTYADDAPELDHIQPLARGGEHSYRNTQCACRRCNGAKSDRPLGQTLLFG